MSLSLQTHSIGDIAVVACGGRIVEGPEAAALDSYVKDLLPLQPHILLDLRNVPFIDSAGLGLLVRLVTRARAAHGDLKLCAAGPHIRDVLKVTKLNTILNAYDTDVEAIAAFYAPTASMEAPASLDIDIVCVDPSPDVLAYLRELLKQAGYGVTTATNLPDARILIRATRPKVVVTNSAMRSMLTSGMPDGSRVVDLPEHFSTEDAGEAAQQVLDCVGVAMVVPRHYRVRAENR